jgi:hypothetical protein
MVCSAGAIKGEDRCFHKSCKGTIRFNISPNGFLPSLFVVLIRAGKTNVSIDSGRRERGVLAEQNFFSVGNVSFAIVLFDAKVIRLLSTVGQTNQS